MRLLLDTNILIALIEQRVRPLGHQFEECLAAPENVLHASVASLWEIAIKFRLGKLPISVPPPALPELFLNVGLPLLSIEVAHVLAEVAPEPDTRDPFDRLLLAQCQVEGLRLVTTDRALAVHPLAWHP